MLSGTQLDFAYGGLDEHGFNGSASGHSGPMDFAPASFDSVNEIVMSRKSDHLNKSEKHAAQYSQAKVQQVKQSKQNDVVEDLIPKGIPVRSQIVKAVAPPPEPQSPSPPHQYFDPASFNRQFIEQQQQTAASYLKHMQNNTEQIQQFSQPEYPQNGSGPGYFDKLFSKKKEFFKLLQWVLIIVLAISIHFVIKHYLKQYISSNDLSPERETILRFLYPAGILFILWNLRIFTKP